MELIRGCLKPVKCTCIDEKTVSYTNGYDTVKISPIPEDLQEGARRIYSVTTPDGAHKRISFTIDELYAFVNKELYSISEKRYSLKEFELACKEKGELHGIVKLSLHSFDGVIFTDYLLINSLVDILAYGPHGIDVDYEIMGFEDKIIYTMIILRVSEKSIQ